MPNARYYREQARLLLQWASDAGEPDDAQRLTTRAQEMISLALQAETESRQSTDALAHFNARQMTGKTRRKVPQA